MLKILAGGNQLDTGGSSFNLTLTNPIFSDDLTGSYIFNFKIPASPRNKGIFDYPARLHRLSSKAFDLDCKVFFDGILIVDESTITIKSGNAAWYECNVKVGAGSIFYKLQNVMLKDIDLGGDRELCHITEIPIPYYNSTTQGVYPQFDFVVFPVYNRLFYFDTIKEAFWDQLWQYINYYCLGSFYSDTETGGSFSQFPYAAYIIDQIFKGYGFLPGNNVFRSNTDLKSLVIYNNLSHTETYWYANPNPPPSGIYAPKAHHIINLANHVPAITALEFLKAMRVFGITYFLTPERQFNIKFIKDILDSTDHTDISHKIESRRDFDIDKYNGYSLAYEQPYSDDLADTYFIKDLSGYNVKDPVDTHNNLPTDSTTEVNDVRFVIDEDVYYIFRYNENAGYHYWDLYCHRFVDLIKEGENKFSLASKFSPLLEYRIPDLNTPPLNREWLVPWIKQKGTNKYFNFKSSGILFVNDPGYRFTFYRGLQYDNNNELYPLGSNDVYDFARNKIANANLSLKWEGEYGLYKQCWKRYLDWRLATSKIITGKIRLTPSEIRDFDLSRKYRIEGIDFLVKEIRIPISSSSIGLATIELYPVGTPGFTTS